VLLLQPSRELLQLGVRLVQPHSWFQASDELVRGSGALIERKRVDSHLQRDPQLRGERRVERGREHADDGVGGTVELDRAADRRRVAREQPLPESMTEQRAGRAARTVLIRREEAARNGLHAERRQIGGGDGCRDHPLGFTPVQQMELPLCRQPG